MVSSEVESLARTGGLGDVVEALSLALAELGAEVVVVTPLYGVTRLPRQTTRWDRGVEARFGWGPDEVRHCEVVEVEPTRFASGGSRRICLLDDPQLYQRGGIYGDHWGAFGDNALRFAVMSRGALEVAARNWPDGPDIIHAHDWHATFAILYAKLVMGERWAKTPAVFTVHNLQFQGVLEESQLDRLHLPREAFRPEWLEHHGQVNLMKGATALADQITTVSPTYAREILGAENGFGLDHHLRAHADRLRGIVNGIDQVRFDPSIDAALSAHYDVRTFAAGRAACRTQLAKDMGIELGEGPLFGVVSRLTWQKGLDLFMPLFSEIVERDARIVIVGQGDPDLEHALLEYADRFAGRLAVRIAFDPALSRRVYAGSDFFVVPSRFEPCGLTQMYAMRYGALPIVTDVGGLHDTVEPIAGDRGTGLVARHPGIEPLREACDAAFGLWADRNALHRAVVRAMSEDFSWSGPARSYVALYEELIRSTR